jgi:hypothetical protein
MRSRLIKANIEPLCSLSSVRCFDYRSDRPLCLECQFTEKHYAEQRHPKSCDGGGHVRRTASPRPLAEAAGVLGALAFLQVVEDGDSAAQWYAHEWQFNHATGKGSRSQLSANPNCRCNHAEAWSQLEHLDAGPATLSLATLLDRAEIAPETAAVTVRSCHRLSTRARCRKCGEESRQVLWLPDLDARAGRCPKCRGPLQAVPFWTSWQMRLDEMFGVLRKPLAKWGVAPHAVLEFAAGSRRKAFAIGED